MKTENTKSDKVVPDIVLLGMNHNTAPVELRECLAFSKEETDTSLESLKIAASIEEVILFSTCNRVEVLLTTRHRNDAVETVKTFLSEFKAVPVRRFEDAFYVHDGD
ncbi:MAG: hypothetical protein ABII68_05500, partial [Pseudomonadota bacterium]